MQKALPGSGTSTTGVGDSLNLTSTFSVFVPRVASTQESSTRTLTSSSERSVSLLRVSSRNRRMTSPARWVWITRLVHEFPQLVGNPDVTSIEQCCAGLDKSGNGREWLIAFMRQGRAHGTERAGSRNAQQVVLQFIDAFSCALVFRKVVDRSQEQRTVASTAAFADRKTHRES